MDLFLFPLQNVPQVFEISMVDVNYNLTVKWNDAFEGGWVFDLQNTDTGEDLVANVPFVVGTNLLAGLDYLGIGGEIYVYTDGASEAVPTLDNLGVESNLYFIRDEVA